MLKEFEISIPSYEYKMKIKYTYGDNIILDLYGRNNKIGSVVIHFEDTFNMDKPLPLYNLNRQHQKNIRKSLVEYPTTEYKDSEVSLYRNFQLYMTKLIFRVNSGTNWCGVSNFRPHLSGEKLPNEICVNVLREFKRFNLKSYLRDERLQKILTKVK